MSEADREKWDARYREGAYVERKHPSAMLAEWLPRLELDELPRRALDVASGSGRNALFLARAGWQVDAIDISEVALERLRERAEREGLPVRALACDLEPEDAVAPPLPVAGPYGLVLVIRYTQLSLLGRLAERLAPGGYLLVELHLTTDADVIGPADARFRVAPGTLRRAAEGLEVVHYEEGIVTDPDGRRAALARLLARRRASTRAGRPA